jgi:hypothetical protein
MADLTNNNVSPLVSPDILATLKVSQQPKAFGDQLLKTGLAAGANAALNSTIAKLYKEKADLITEGIQLDVNHRSTLLKYENQYNIDKKQAENDPQKLSEIEKRYEEKVAFETISYEKAKKNLQERKDKNKKDIDNSIRDPFAAQKEKRKASQERIKKLKNKSKKEKQEARKQKRKAVLQNTRKTIVSTLTLLLTDRISDIISQNDVIKKLVDDTNIIIEEANASNNPAKLENAKIVRDNAIRVIQNNENRINQINKQIQNISITISIFSIVVNTIGPSLLPVPVPSPAPDVVTPPKENFRTRVYEPALKILNALSALLPTIIISLQKAIQTLEELKAQLLPINGELESKLPPIAVAFGTDYGSYKGFIFALREENNPRFVVQGNKRHYAVAINKQNIEQLKSESSFTLDPNDLIEQLKLVIDQQNLQG